MTRLSSQRVIRATNEPRGRGPVASTSDLARRVEQLNALNEISLAMAGSVDVRYVLGEIISRAVALADADAGAIFQYEPALGLEFGAAHHRDRIAIDELGLQTEGLALLARLASQRQSTHLADLNAERDIPPQIDGDPLASADLVRLRSLGVQAFLAMPLLRGNELMGVLWLGRAMPGEFPVETVQLITTFAAQSSVAIHNARLFDELRRYADALDVANQHKSDFLARMSHELRTPLNAVIGFSEVLMDRAPEEFSEGRRKAFLSHIHRSGKHLLELISDILDLAKVNAGELELHLASFSVAELIESCAAVLRVAADQKGISLTTSIEPVTSTMVADPTRMKQIVYNLLANAVKFTPRGGQASITAHVTADETLVEVRDTGIGISPDDQLVIFDEFRQASRPPNQEGTGLSLAVVRRLVELHGGRIWVTSATGQGSCFAFTVPNCDVPPSSLQ